MNQGFSIFRLCAVLIFVVICFLLVMEKTNLNKTAEVTGMEDVIEQTKRELASVSHAFNLTEKKFETPMGKVFKREHSAYTLYVSCLHNGPLYGFLRLGKDTGDIPRENRFFIDEKLPEECRQLSTKSYKAPYHRGHLFAANHFDDKKQHMFESFYMSNVVPQHQVSNTGAWKQTEIITECYREHHNIHLAAGVIYGNDSADDHFIDTHGVVTPTAMWKLIVLDDSKYAAWIIPNSNEAKAAALSDYEVAISDLMRITNIQVFKTPESLQRVKLPIFKTCHVS